MSVCEIKNKSNDQRDWKEGWFWKAHFLFSQLISLNLLRIKSSNYFGFGVAAAERTSAGGIWLRWRVKVITLCLQSPRGCSACVPLVRRSPTKFSPPVGGVQEEVRAEIQQESGGFPGGAVVENLPANAGDTGSSPGLGRSHMPRSN